MIRDREAWVAWEDEYLRDNPPDFYENLSIYEALYIEACALGILPPEDPCEGLRDKIRLAKAINVSG